MALVMHSIWNYSKKNLLFLNSELFEGFKYLFLGFCTKGKEYLGSVCGSFASSWKDLPADEQSFLAYGNVWLLTLFLLSVEGGASKGRSVEVAILPSEFSF